jgi:chemotaxis signal transduction protein
VQSQIGISLTGATVQLAEAAPDGFLGGRWDMNEILESRQILEIMDLPRVPQNTRLIKGVLETVGKSIPLIDLRIKLGLRTPESQDTACALIVDVGGVEIGLISDLPAA